MEISKTTHRCQLDVFYFTKKYKSIKLKYQNLELAAHCMVLFS